MHIICVCFLFKGVHIMAMNEIALFKGIRIQPYQKYIDFMFAGALAFIFWYIVYTFCLLIINQLIKNWIY